MKLNITPLSQRDPKWANKKLGTSSVSNIGGYGCLLVCHSMALKYFGHDDMDPIALNEKYKSAGVFDLGSMINYFAAGQVFPDFKATGYLNYYDVPADLSKIDEMLDRRMPVIVGLGATPTEPKKLEYDNAIDHFVLIIGKDNGEYLINDPWEGETYFFSAKYGDPNNYIFGLRLYEGPVEEEQNYEDKIKDLQDKVNAQAEQILEQSVIIGQLEGELKQQEADNKDITTQLSKERSEKNTLIREKEKLQREVVKLQESIDELNNEATTLKSSLRALQNSKFESISTWTLVQEILYRVFKNK